MDSVISCELLSGYKFWSPAIVDDAIAIVALLCGNDLEICTLLFNGSGGGVGSDDNEIESITLPFSSGLEWVERRTEAAPMLEGFDVPKLVRTPGSKVGGGGSGRVLSRLEFAAEGGSSSLLKVCLLMVFGLCSLTSQLTVRYLVPPHGG